MRIPNNRVARSAFGLALKELNAAEVRIGDAYHRIRDQTRVRVAGTRRDQRVSLGGRTLVFESRLTLLLALEEALRAERVTDQARVAAEVAAFNQLVPPEGDLIACLYIDAADQAELGGRLGDAGGVDGAVYLDIGGSRSRAVPEASEAGAPAAVSLLRFQLEPDQRRALAEGAEVAAGVEHPSFREHVLLSPAQREALAACL